MRDLEIRIYETLVNLNWIKLFWKKIRSIESDMADKKKCVNTAVYFFIFKLLCVYGF